MIGERPANLAGELVNFGGNPSERCWRDDQAPEIIA